MLIVMPDLSNKIGIFCDLLKGLLELSTVCERGGVGEEGGEKEAEGATDWHVNKNAGQID